MSVPFSWQDKRMLRRISQEIEDYGTAMAVYNALTVAASDTQAEEFQTTHAWLSKLSGFGARTVGARLADLKRIGVIDFTTPKLKAPCVYRLLPFGNGCGTLGNGCRTFGNGNPRPLPRSEESKFSKGKPAPVNGKLGTGDRIGIEKVQKLLKDQIQKLEDATYYEHDRKARPELVAELKEKREKLAELGAKLIGGAV